MPSVKPVFGQINGGNGATDSPTQQKTGSTLTDPATTTDSSGGLSTQATTYVAVGSVIGGILLVTLAIWLYRRQYTNSTAGDKDARLTKKWEEAERNMFLDYSSTYGKGTDIGSSMSAVGGDNNEEVTKTLQAYRISALEREKEREKEKERTRITSYGIDNVTV